MGNFFVRVEIKKRRKIAQKKNEFSRYVLDFVQYCQREGKTKNNVFENTLFDYKYIDL